MTQGEYRSLRDQQNAQHRKEFPEWAKRRGVEVYAKAEDAGVDTSLKVGDKVTFTNDNGCVFDGHTVLGFRKVEQGDILPEFVVYIDYDCYWSPARLSSLTVE